MNIGAVLNQMRRKWCSVRMLTLLIVWAMMLDTCLAGYRQEAMAYGIKDAAAILPHLQNDFYFNKIMLLSVACFFSDVPFMERGELYVVARLGKQKWGYRNIIYIFGSGIFLSFLLMQLSVVLILPATNFSNEWGELYQTFAVTETGGGIIFNQQAMYAYAPCVLQMHIFLMDAAAFSVIGLLLYVMSLYQKRVWAYAVTVVLIFFPSFIGKMGLPLDNFSPFSWIETIHWRFGYDNSKPDLAYIYTAYLLLLLVLSFAAQYKIRKTDWKNREEGR